MLFDIKIFLFGLYIGVNVTLIVGSIVFFIRSQKIIFFYNCIWHIVNTLFMLTSNDEILKQFYPNLFSLNNKFAALLLNTSILIFTLLSVEINSLKFNKWTKTFYYILIFISPLFIILSFFIEQKLMFIPTAVVFNLLNFWALFTAYVNIKNNQKQSIWYIVAMALVTVSVFWAIFNKSDLKTSAGYEYIGTIVISLVNTFLISISIYQKINFEAVVQKSIIVPSEKLTLNFDKSFFTKRELEVIDALILGLTDKEISENLNLSKFTIKSHLRNIYEKTNSKNRLELVVKLNKKGDLR